MSGGEKFVKSGAADAANFIFNWINARRENKVSKRQGEHNKLYAQLFEKKREKIVKVHCDLTAGTRSVSFIDIPKDVFDTMFLTMRA